MVSNNAGGQMALPIKKLREMRCWLSKALLIQHGSPAHGIALTGAFSDVLTSHDPSFVSSSSHTLIASALPGGFVQTQVGQSQSL